MQSFAQDNKKSSLQAPAHLIGSRVINFKADRKIYLILQLQPTIGNKALQRLIAQPKLIVNQPNDRCEQETDMSLLNPLAIGLIQAKLAVSQPGDEYEREAEGVAHQIMDVISSFGQDSIQRKEEEQNLKDVVDKEDKTVRRQVREVVHVSAADSTSAKEVIKESDLEKAIIGACGGGRSLERDIQEPMERAFGANFSDVRVHNDDQSDQLSRSIHARAFTYGRDIFFRHSEYYPSSRVGKELIAHELVHVLQQTECASDIARKSSVSWRQQLFDPDHLESEAYKNGSETWINIAYIESPVQKRTKGLEVQRDFAEDWFSDAIAIYNRGNNNAYRQAITEFEGVRQIEGITTEMRGQCLYYLGMCNVRLNRRNSAIIYFEEALPLLRQDTEMSREARRQLTEAMSQPEMAPSAGEPISQEDANRQFVEALTSFKRERYPQARNQFNALLRSPGLSDNLQGLSLYYLGLCNFRTNQWVSTIRELERARHMPTLAENKRSECLYYIGQCYIRQQNWELANIYLQEFLEMSGIDPELQTQARNTLQIARGNTAPDEHVYSTYSLEFRGERTRAGYRYNGEGSRQFCEQELGHWEVHFNEIDRADLAEAVRLFRRLLPLEGYISAINTWDGQRLTWGAGFAFRGALPSMYQHLSDETKGFLQDNAGYRFSHARITNIEGVELDRHALGVLVHVSETDPFRVDVLRAQFRTFIRTTLGYSEAGVAPTRPELPENINVLAAHLTHWLPACFAFPRDLSRVREVAGENPNETLLAASTFKVFVNNMLLDDRFGRIDNEGRHRLKEGRVGWNPIAHFANNLAHIWRSSSQSIDVSNGRVQELIPAFTTNSRPYFQGGSLDAMPSGNLILEDPQPSHSNSGPVRFYNFGSPLP